MEYLADWRLVIWLAASSCFDLVWWCCRVTLSAMAGDSTARVPPLPYQVLLLHFISNIRDHTKQLLTHLIILPYFFYLSLNLTAFDLEPLHHWIMPHQLSLYQKFPSTGGISFPLPNINSPVFLFFCILSPSDDPNSSHCQGFVIKLYLLNWRLTSSPATGDNTPRDTNYTDTCPPSRKLYKLDEPDTQDTAGEARKSS